MLLKQSIPSFLSSRGIYNIIGDRDTTRTYTIRDENLWERECVRWQCWYDKTCRHTFIWPLLLSVHPEFGYNCFKRTIARARVTQSSVTSFSSDLIQHFNSDTRLIMIVSNKHGVVELSSPSETHMHYICMFLGNSIYVKCQNRSTLWWCRSYMVVQ